MVRLAALSAGAGVPGGDFAGRVAEVHARGSLVELPDGALLTLLGEELGGQPSGITLATPPGFLFSRELESGAGLAARAGMMRLAGGTLIVDLRAARPWRSNLEGLGIDLATRSVRVAWRAAWAALQVDGRSEQFVALAGGAIAALVAATRDGDGATARDAICRLVGLGAGRTPAGDDFLVGYLAGLQASRMREAIRPIVAKLCSHLRELAARTNRLSRLYLDAAAEGEISERLRDVARAIASGGEAGEMRRVLTAALAVGHCSGAAGVLGLLHGSAAGSPIQSEAEETPSDRAPVTLAACSPLSANHMQIAPSSR